MAALAISAAFSWGASAGATALGISASATFMGMTAAGWGWAIGSYVGGQLLAPDTYGPKMQDLRVQVSTYGVPVSTVYGTARIGGNVIWSTDLIEHANKESAKGGPSYTTYTYTVSCAVALCEGEITGIQKIWANNELIYDVTPGNTGPTGFDYSIKVYPGSETQTADPRMQAELGAANTPAHRGMAYVVFEDFALEKFGNRMPQFNFQVVRDGVAARPAVTSISASNGSTPIYNPDTDTFVARPSSTTIGLYNAETGALIRTETYPLGQTVERLEAGPPGLVMAIDETAGTFFVYDAATLTLIDTLSKPGWSGNGQWSEYHSSFILAKTNLSSDIAVYRYFYGVWDPYVVYSTSPLTTKWGGINCTTDGYTVLFNGSRICVLGREFQVVLDYECSPIELNYGQLFQYSAYDPVRNRVYCSGAKLFVVDIATMTVTDYTSPDTDYIFYHAQADALIGINAWASSDVYVYDLDDLPNYHDTWSITSPTNTTGFMFERSGIADAVFVAGETQYRRIPFGNRITANPYPLHKIVSEQCLKAGLTAGDIDVTALADLVDGYVVNQQSSARSNIEPLQIAYFFDAVESDDKLKFVKRGGSSAVTVPEVDIGAYEYGTTRAMLLEQSRTHETEIPRQVSINYLNINAEYQQNTQYDRRLTGDANIETTLTLPVAMDDDEAAQVAAVNLYAAWANRNRVKFATGVKYSRYEPTDIVTVNKGNTAHTLRIVKKDEGGNGLIAWEAVAEDSAVYTQTVTGAAALSMPTQTITLPVTTRLELLDIPLLRDVDDDAGFYYAAAGHRTGWDGAQIYKSTDSGASWFVTSTVTDESTVGTATDALGTFQTGSMFDEGNTVTVRLANSGLTLASVSYENVLNGANPALLGNEIIQFRTATLNGDGSYTLSGLLRGRRGTDPTTAHAAGERFVLFNTVSTGRISADSSEIDLARDYRAVSFYTTLAQTTNKTFTNTGVGLMPLSPVHIGGGRDASGNITIKWNRRTRVGGEWRDYVNATLGESTESYEVEIYTDGTYVTLKRTITGITSETTSYSSANQVTDFGGNQSTIYIKVFQLSATVGRGFEKRGTV